MQDDPRVSPEVNLCQRISASCVHLGPRALQLLADIAERLAKGAKQYGGDFDDKPRDWVQETLEETADGLVYASMKLLEVREAKAADEARNRAARRLSDEAQIKERYASERRNAYQVVSSHDYGQNREPLGPDFYKHYGPPTERDGVWAECSSKPTWPLNTPGEDWEKTRAGCG